MSKTTIEDAARAAVRVAEAGGWQSVTNVTVAAELGVSPRTVLRLGPFADVVKAAEGWAWLTPLSCPRAYTEVAMARMSHARRKAVADTAGRA